MREPGVQRDGKKGATITSYPILQPVFAADERRAPVAILSPTKRAALVECFNNSGLHKRNGYWWGASEGKHISGVTVADLARDGMLSVIKTLQYSSALLTDHGQWFARTLIDTANDVQIRE